MTLWFCGEDRQPLLEVTGHGTPGQQGTRAGRQTVGGKGCWGALGPAGAGGGRGTLELLSLAVPLDSGRVPSPPPGAASRYKRKATL